MTEKIQLKARVNVEIRDAVKRHSDARNLSQSDSIEQLLAAALSQATDSESVQDLLPHAREAEEQIGAAVERVWDRIDARMTKLSQGLKKSVVEAMQRGSIASQPEPRDTTAETLKPSLEGVEQRLAKMEFRLAEAVESLRAQAPEEPQKNIENPARFFDDLRFYSGVVAGAVALVFLVQILPGSSVPARALAGFVVGESDATSAAAIVAGQGDRFDAAALRATLALAADDAFIKDYKSCIERAKKASEQTRCTLRFPQVN